MAGPSLCSSPGAWGSNSSSTPSLPLQVSSSLPFQVGEQSRPPRSSVPWNPLPCQRSQGQLFVGQGSWATGTHHLWCASQARREAQHPRHCLPPGGGRSCGGWGGQEAAFAQVPEKWGWVAALFPSPPSCSEDKGG